MKLVASWEPCLHVIEIHAKNRFFNESVILLYVVFQHWRIPWISLTTPFSFKRSTKGEMSDFAYEFIKRMEQQCYDG